MDVAWLLSLALFGSGAVLLASAVPQLVQRRRVRAQLAALNRHRPNAEDDYDEAELLRPSAQLEGWAALLARFPRIANVRLLRSAGLSWTVERYLLLRSAAGLVVGACTLVLSHSLLIASAGLAVGTLLPTMYARRRRAKRIAAFADQLPAAIELISRAVRAGHPLVHGLKMAGDDTPAPLGTELRVAYEEHRFGMPLDEALTRLGERLELTDARILITAILVQRDAGGNIAEVFERLAQLMRERITLNRQVRVHTAQGRMSGYVLSSLPVIVAGLMLIVNPGYIRLLVNDPIGRAMLAGAIIMQIAGHLWISRIVKIDI